MMKLLASIERFWFEPAPASRLAILRIASGLYALWYVWTRQGMLARIGRGYEFLFAPVGLAHVLQGPLDPVIFDWIVIATIASGVVFILGLGFRVSGPVFALLLFATLSYRNSWSMIYHSNNALIIHILILSIASSADAVSLDALIRQWSGRRRAPNDAAYGWPIKLICAVTCATYFVAGAAKVMGPLGFAWAGGESIRSQLAVDAIRKEVLQLKPMAHIDLLYNQIWLFWVFGVVTFILELGAPFALVRKRIGWIWALATLGMHWGIFFLMGIRFRYQMSGLIFFSFFPMESIFHQGRLTIQRFLKGAGRRPIGQMRLRRYD